MDSHLAIDRMIPRLLDAKFKVVDRLRVELQSSDYQIQLGLGVWPIFDVTAAYLQLVADPNLHSLLCLDMVQCRYR